MYEEQSTSEEQMQTNTLNKNMMTCTTCGKPIAKNAKRCPYCGAKNKKKIYKRFSFWIAILLVVIVCFTAFSAFIQKIETKVSRKVLIKYLKDNFSYGSYEYGDVYTEDRYKYMISYVENKDELSFVLFVEENDGSNSMYALKNIGEKEISFLGHIGITNHMVSGYIYANTFSWTNKQIYNFKTQDNYLYNEEYTLCGTSISLLLTVVNGMLQKYDIGVTVKKLGFENY